MLSFRLDVKTRKIVLTAASAYLGRFSQAIVILVTMPMVYESLNPELFGVWMMLSAFLGFMSFADFGVGNGVLNNITRAKSLGDTHLLSSSLISGYFITVLVGLSALVAWFCWLGLSVNPTSIAGSISTENKNEVMGTLTVFTVIFAANISLSLIQKVQLGMQQGYLNGINQLISALLVATAIFFILGNNGGILLLVYASFGIPAAVNLVNTLLWLHRNDLIGIGSLIDSFDSKIFCQLIRSGGMFLSIQLAAAFAFQSDVIVITQTLGQETYGNFAIVQKLFIFISTLLVAALLGLWPAFGDAMTIKNIVWVKKAIVRSLLLVFLLTTFAVSSLCLLMPWILSHWLKLTVYPAWTLLAVLSIWTILEGMGNVTAAFLNGANILRAQVLIVIGMGSTAFILKWFLVPSMGPTGSVLSTIVAYCFISIPAIFLILRKSLKSEI